MRAAVFRTFGPADVLEICELPVPEIGTGDILVRVRANTVQPFDVAARAGKMPMAPDVDLPLVTGNEFAGEIVALGKGVEEFAVGERVSGRHLFGCAAEYLSVRAIDVARTATTLDFAQAAYLGGTGQTAHMAVEFLKVGPGDTFLINGGSGGVGSIAIQLGVMAGARVIATGSSRNQDYLRTLGAEPIIYGDRLKERIEIAASQTVTVVLDCVGGEALDAAMALGVETSRIATLNDYKRYEQLGVRRPAGERNGIRLRKLMDLAQANRLKVHIRKTFTLDDIAEAHRDVEAGHGPGKVAVLMP